MDKGGNGRREGRDGNWWRDEMNDDGRKGNRRWMKMDLRRRRKLRENRRRTRMEVERDKLERREQERV